MLALGNIHAVWGLEVVASQYVVNIVDSSGSHPDFGKVSGPHTTVGVFGLILGVVGGVDVVVDVAISFIPLLVVKLLVVVVGRVDGEMISDPCGQLDLLVHLVKQQIILLSHVAVTVGAVCTEDLKAYIIFK